MPSCSTGVYIEEGGILQFHEATPPTDDEMDLFGSGSDARLNHPGVASGNWRWRLKPG